jgi:magnesium chelatase family protein
MRYRRCQCSTPGSISRLAAPKLLSLSGLITCGTSLRPLCLHRVAGLTGAPTAVVTTRPCRAPHHTISDMGLIGGGQVPLLPGEVSRAHHGVLFLDELPEFRRHVLEVLRQPFEKSIVSIQSPASHRPRRAGCDRRAARDTNQIAGTMVVPDKDALA